jgi:hypothetical protein
LYLLGISNTAEPYYWLFILLTSVPFVLFSFLVVRLVSPLSFRDVLHLSFYPIVQRYGIVHDKDGDDCTVSSAQGLADAYLAYLKKGPKPSGLYVLR